MKYSIVFISRTGNTALLAKSLQENLPKEDCEYFGEPSENALGTPIIFIGFWTDKGSCDEETKAFIKSLTNKKIFLFGTAGFGGSTTYYQKILDSTKLNIDTSVEVIGSFMCQGKMPDSVLLRYEKMLSSTEDSARIKEMISNFHTASSHPDEKDFEDLKKAATILF